MTNEDTVLNIDAPGVLENDTDLEADTLSSVVVTGPLHGTLALAGNGSFVYTPEGNYSGPDSFTYRANDGDDSNEAIVTITVNAVNDPPLAVDDSYSVDEDNVLEVDAATGMLANDLDENMFALTISIVDGPFNGSLEYEDDGSFIYTPTDNFSGTDSFLYQLNDGNTDSNFANVTITVEPTNDEPIGTSDSYEVEVNGFLSVESPGVLGNDTDPDGDALDALLGEGPYSGILTLNTDGSFEYDPNDGFVGQDSFTYTLGDGFGGSTSVGVTINVGAPPP